MVQYRKGLSVYVACNTVRKIHTRVFYVCIVSDRFLGLVFTYSNVDPLQYLAAVAIELQISCRVSEPPSAGND